MDFYVRNPVGPFHLAAGAAFGTFTTFQDISPTERPVLLGRSVRVGSKLELEAWGEFSTTGAPTLQLGFWLGSAATVLLASGVITTGTGAAAWPWHLKGHLLVTSISGTTGTAIAQGILDLGTSLTAFASSACPVTAAGRSLTNLDFSVNKDVGIGAAYGTSNAANTVKCNELIVDLVN